MSLRKQKSQGKAVEVTVNSKEENSEDFCPDFIQEFGLAGWLEQNGPAGCDFIRDGRSMPALRICIERL